MSKSQFKIPSTIDHPLIIGGGVVGMTLALGLRKIGLDVMILDGGDVLDSRATGDTREKIVHNKLPTDLRTVALWQGSVQLLKNIGVWAGMIGDNHPSYEAVPLEKLRLMTPTLDGTAIASDVHFQASDLNLHSLGYNIPVSRLRDVLLDHCEKQGVNIVYNNPIETINHDGTRMTVTTKNGDTITAPVVLSTEGRNSPIRQGMGIDMDTSDYGLSALVGVIEHTQPHNFTSQEIHHPNGPFTVVPMADMPSQKKADMPSQNNMADSPDGTPPYRNFMSAIVWVDKTDTIADLAMADEQSFNTIMQDTSLGILGDVKLLGKRQVFPLSCRYAKTLGGAGYVLLGESAHVLPPFAAQGMNLSLRDVAEYCDQLQTALQTGMAMGDARIAMAYQKNRLPDIRARVKSVDTIHNMVFNTSSLLHTARSKGMQIIDKFSPLRRVMVTVGMQGIGGDPKWMKEL